MVVDMFAAVAAAMCTSAFLTWFMVAVICDGDALQPDLLYPSWLCLTQIMVILTVIGTYKAMELAYGLA